jgi:hypothetical protein
MDVWDPEWDTFEVHRDRAYEEEQAATGAIHDADENDVCEVCGEGNGRYDDVVAEFWDKLTDRSVPAHAECGLNQGWSLA